MNIRNVGIQDTARLSSPEAQLPAVACEDPTLISWHKDDESVRRGDSGVRFDTVVPMTVLRPMDESLWPSNR
jgi:hypothetical protein